MIFILSALSFLMAASSFLAELNLAQAMSATLGGTALRFQTTFGLFTFSLGLGAWIYTHLRTHVGDRNLLIVSQVFLIGAHLASPFWISWANPLIRENSLFFLALTHLPIIITGFLSGLELPALLKIENTFAPHRFQTLTWDYIGMFFVSLIFPTWLLYEYGVFGVNGICALLTSMSLLLTFRIPKTPSKDTGSILSKSVHNIRLLALVFTLSFCSFSYQLLMSKSISEVIHNETIAYSAGVGFLLLGMGVGTWLSRICKNASLALCHVEFFIILLASLQFVMIYLTSIFFIAYSPLNTIIQSQWLCFLILSPLPFSIGILTGFELPLLLRIFKTDAHWGTPIALNYFGALVSGFSVPLFFIPNFSVAQSLQIICCINLLAWAYLLMTQKKKQNWFLIQSLIICSVFLNVGTWNRFTEQFFLKIYYYNLKVSNISFHSIEQLYKISQTIDPVQRTTTAYQFIDKVKNTFPHTLFKKENAVVYLNKQQQFDTNNWRTYHESFILGAKMLSKTPVADVLICGGGDGLLAHLLRQDPNIQKITMVELDPEMIYKAREDFDFLSVNEDALSDPKVEVIIADAYKWVHESTHQYDAIYIDFPYPSSFDLSRLYSVEFYRAIFRRLKKNGFIILDAPIWRYIDREPKGPTEQQILKDTLKAAGFRSFYAFGSIEPLLFATPQEQTLSFDYSLLPDDTSHRTFVNLVSINFLERRSPDSAPQINSVLFPKRFLENE